MAEIVFKNANIHFQQYGNEKGSAVVLLHGFLESSNMWHSFIATLPKKYRIISIDLPGHGKSESIGYTHQMELMAEAVAAVLNHLNIKKYHVIGHSMGGYVALAMAELLPDTIKSLTLWHSTALADSAEKKLARDKALALVMQNHKSFIRLAIPALFRPKCRSIFRDAINQLKHEALQMSANAVAAAIRGMKIRKSREVVLKFGPFPSLLVIGKHDKAILPEAVLKLAELNPKIEVLYLPQAAHMSHIECADEANLGVKKFLAKHA